MNQKIKMKLWKKIVLISVASFITLLILVGVFMDEHKLGIELYNKKDYKGAYGFLQRIKPNDKNYADASVKATNCKRIIDSLQNIADQNKINEEKSKLEAKNLKEKQDGLTKANQQQIEISTNRKERIEKQFSAWDGSHIQLERYIKEIMNDPDSYQHVETRYRDMGDYLIITTKFRGDNSFGGKVVNYMKAKVDLDGNILEIYK